MTFHQGLQDEAVKDKKVHLIITEGLSVEYIFSLISTMKVMKVLSFLYSLTTDMYSSLHKELCEMLDSQISVSAFVHVGSLTANSVMVR